MNGLTLGVPQAARPRLTLGPEAIDSRLGGGLARHALHEAGGAGAAAFALALAGRLPAPTIWIAAREREGALYPCGLASVGVDPQDLIVVAAPARETAWAFEQALRSGAAGAVIAEAASLPDFKHSRRLQLAARESGTLGLMLTPPRRKRGDRTPTSAAETRWRIDFARTAAREAPPRYALELQKNKSGPLGIWEVDWHAPTHRFHLAAAA